MKTSVPALLIALSACTFVSNHQSGAGLGVQALAIPADPDACRDCAFPLRVDHGRWLMPNGQVEFEVNEEPYDKNSVRVIVTLRNARTKELLAQGSTIRLNFKNNFFVELTDKGGKKVQGQIRWINKFEERLQAKFTCTGPCTISSELN